MTQILINGGGRMGQAIERQAERLENVQVVGMVEPEAGTLKSISDFTETADLVIDFSTDKGTKEAISFCKENNVPLVCGTTALSEETKAELAELNETTPVYYSANMSTGIGILDNILENIMPSVEGEFDIEIIEKHHNQKKDAPSGTALLLADAILRGASNEKEIIYGREGNDLEKTRDQIGIHAVRGGSIPGEHTVIFAGQDEIIELKHTALSRDIFALGAINQGLKLAKANAKIRIAIVGYGNLGRGVQKAVAKNPDTEVMGIFTRRNPDSITPIIPAPVYHIDTILDFKGEIDVAILCGGSATDLMDQTPMLVENFNVVDSFDTHANIPAHFANVEKAAKKGGNLGLISAGWDPGMFSLNRLYAQAIEPAGKDYTFWGKGISQGHSDAIRRIEGVADAKQYTIPVEESVNRVRRGENPELTTREKHLRECFVVAKEGADQEKIRQEIVTMENYFADYDTIVNFISQEELDKNHSGMPHGGFVIRSGETGNIIEYSLQLPSNPDFTSSVLVAYARAVHKMALEGKKGCVTVLDVPPSMLSMKSPQTLRKELL